MGVPSGGGDKPGRKSLMLSISGVDKKKEKKKDILSLDDEGEGEKKAKKSKSPGLALMLTFSLRLCFNYEIRQECAAVHRFSAA